MNYYSWSIWPQEKTWRMISLKNLISTKIFWYFSMKIKYSLLCLLVVTLWIFAEDCNYLKDPTQSYVDMDYEWSFNYEYPYQLCLLNNPIHTEAVAYIQGIRDVEGKTVRELVTDVGNKFCRGYFWECDENSFYGRFLTACNMARSKTADILKENKQPETINSQFVSFSYSGCPVLADKYISAYKEVAMDEITRYHGKIIESSNYTYLKDSHEKSDTLSGIMSTFVKILWNIARSFQWFTPTVYN